MIYSFENEPLGAYFTLSSDFAADKYLLNKYSNLISIHWNRNKEEVKFNVDGATKTLLPNQLITTTYLQQVDFEESQSPLTTFSFNREFYCIIDHDHEVSCNGILFFGSSANPFIKLDADEVNKFDMLLQVFFDEFKTRDSIQEEMLRMLLKRLIIKLTRLAKKQHPETKLDSDSLDIIRKFNVLIEQNYRQYHHVADYADLLHKSPKTLSNLFSKFNNKTPLQLIHERLVLESKRLLIYTDKSVKEIAFDLGFDSSGAFHKLFKRLENKTPQEFKVGIKTVAEQ